MIIGIGNDVLDTRRLACTLQRFPQRLPQRILTAQEAQALPPPGARRVQFLAVRWAAKEALGKALGIGVRTPLTWRQVSVVHNAAGKPSFVFAAAAAAFLQHSGVHTCHLSISHDGTTTCAMVVAEGADK